jgi:hypothetical protein
MPGLGNLFLCTLHDTGILGTFLLPKREQRRFEMHLNAT